ncbi:MAG: trypsin-like peptidase domain-containing protein [Pseudomonadota bacterium]|nr:trypsin-like peptidase domain-containing protein [Pseudomonadota bacterium]
MLRLALFLLALAMAAAPGRADDISAAARSVVRVVVVAVEGDEIVGFGHGSGFAVAPNRIVTNAHVVALAVQYPKDVVVGVVPSEGTRSYGARVVQFDEARDLALLEMVEGSLPPVPLFLGPIADGSPVAALGYPGNVDLATARSADDYINPLPPTRSMGNYSNERAINGVSVLLHTADIARGNSGGPLVDPCGRVVGVNTYITRGDEGDSPFGFAVANRELAAFLRAAGQSFNAVTGPCVSMAERLAQEREREEEAERQRLSQEQARDRARQQQLEEMRLSIESARENRAAVAILLLVLSVIAVGGALVMLVKDRSREAMILGGVGAVLLVAAAVVFLTRPGYEQLRIEEEQDASAAQSPSAAFAGEHSCRLVPERSRITVSSGETVELEWTENGCVNGRTQYAREGNVWRRILVPNNDQTVSMLEVRPQSEEYVVNRYLLDAATMARVRGMRQRIAIAACTVDEEAVASLASAQEQLRGALPDLPNERLVYDCSEK